MICIGGHTECPACEVGYPVILHYGYHSLIDMSDNKQKFIQCKGPDKCLLCKELSRKARGSVFERFWKTMRRLLNIVGDFFKVSEGESK